MKRIPYIQLKATFLLIVFSLNTLIGFACAAGVGLGFNSPHHHKEDAVAHNHENTSQHSHSHHEHDDTAGAPHSSHENDENCCKDEVMKFATIDKVTPQSLDLSIHPVFFITFLSSFYYLDVSASYTLISKSKYFARTHHPPIPDIRIAIQSFQI